MSESATTTPEHKNGYTPLLSQVMYELDERYQAYVVRDNRGVGHLRLEGIVQDKPLQADVTYPITQAGVPSDVLPTLTLREDTKTGYRKKYFVPDESGHTYTITCVEAQRDPHTAALIEKSIEPEPVNKMTGDAAIQLSVLPPVEYPLLTARQSPNLKHRILGKLGLGG